MSAENPNAPPPLDCDEKKSIRDDDSVVSDRCWQEMHRGDSRKWLIRDASRQKIDSSTCSTMKATYLYPFQEKREEIMGVRRFLLKKQLFEQMKEEVLEEESQPPPIEEYCTEYDGNFNADGFLPEEDPYKIEPELIEKYPLYGSPAASYWNCQFKATGNVQGVTKVNDSKDPFKRSYNFSKPLSEILDEYPI